MVNNLNARPAEPLLGKISEAEIEATAPKMIKPIVVEPEVRIRSLAASLIRGFESVDQPRERCGA